jgi:hypothetical protein
MASQDPKLAAQALRAALHSSVAPKRKSPLDALGAVVLIATIGIVLIAFLIPVVAPQTTCDALTPMLGCKGGATPSCSMVASGSGRRTGQNLSVQCPEGGGSAAPIYITAITVALVSLGAGMGFIIARVRRRRREELESRAAAMGQVLGKRW